jgi:FkbM family methyltransferase
MTTRKIPRKANFTSVLPRVVKLGLSALVWGHFNIGAYLSCMLEYGITMQSLFYILKGQYPNELKLRNGFCIQAGELKIDLLELFVDIWLKQVYTPNGWEIKPEDVVIDVGANIGMFSLFAANHDPSVKVYSFEPFFGNFHLLKKNRTLNNMRNIRCYNFAVSGYSGIKKLYLTTSSDSGHLLFDHSVVEGRLRHYVEVGCKTLKEVFDENEIGRCNLLKLDCEGSEFAILFNLPKSYFSRIENISLEFHNYLTSYTHLHLKRFLEARGFIVEIVKRSNIRGYLYARNDATR